MCRLFVKPDYYSLLMHRGWVFAYARTGPVEGLSLPTLCQRFAHPHEIVCICPLQGVAEREPYQGSSLNPIQQGIECRLAHVA
jgi:hypothetical protein